MNPVVGAERWSPWAPGEAIRWLIVAAAGHVACFAAWWFASREAVFQDQFVWASLGVAGFVVVAYADVTWLLRARMALSHRRRSLWPDVEESTGADAGSAPVASPVVLMGPGGTRFHRPGCQFAAGKGWPEIDRGAPEVQERIPCELCRP